MGAGYTATSPLIQTQSLAVAPVTLEAQSALIGKGLADTAAQTAQPVPFPWARWVAAWCGAVLILAGGNAAAGWFLSPRIPPADVFRLLSTGALPAESTAALGFNAVSSLILSGVSLLAIAGRNRAGSRNLAAPLWATSSGVLLAISPLALAHSSASPDQQLIRTAGTSVAVLLLVYMVLLRVSPLRPLYWFLLALTSTCMVTLLLGGARFALSIPVAAAIYRIMSRSPWRPWLLFIEFPVIVLGATASVLSLTWIASVVGPAPAMLAFSLSSADQVAGLGEAATLHDEGEATFSWQSIALIGIGLSWAVSPYVVLMWGAAALMRLFDLLGRPLIGALDTLRGRSWEPQSWGLLHIDFLLLTGVCAVAWQASLAAPKSAAFVYFLSPLSLASVPYLLARVVSRLGWWEVPVYGVVQAGMVGYFLAFVGDARALHDPVSATISIVVGPAVLGALFLVLSFSLQLRSISRQLVILGVLLAVAWCWSVSATGRGGIFDARGSTYLQSIAKDSPGGGRMPVP